MKTTKPFTDALRAARAKRSKAIQILRRYGRTTAQAAAELRLASRPPDWRRHITAWRPDAALRAARAVLRGGCNILRRAGRSWEQLEIDLQLAWGHGMTAWRAAGNRHKAHSQKRCA